MNRRETLMFAIQSRSYGSQFFQGIFPPVCTGFCTQVSPHITGNCIWYMPFVVDIWKIFAHSIMLALVIDGFSCFLIIRLSWVRFPLVRNRVWKGLFLWKLSTDWIKQCMNLLRLTQPWIRNPMVSTLQSLEPILAPTAVLRFVCVFLGAWQYPDCLTVFSYVYYVRPTLKFCSAIFAEFILL